MRELREEDLEQYEPPVLVEAGSFSDDTRGLTFLDAEAHLVHKAG